ncbi:putative flippase GtrA [Actinoplanes tereljensis]|uniref:Membrane protein n=1 Tax=Paractinoplanes tereljensis TaxID=571912 RepID=A0A919NSR0_9ACTN|nr:GtrA family protein [Actinoplanes tereljensis]GIF24474.1 membrane protein [Actinoplanes tereljensis]
MPDNPTPQPHGLRTKFRALIHELSKFGTVGAISFAIDLAIFNVLLHAGVETLIAKTISTVIATTVAFTGNRFWTWRHRAHANMARQYTMFFVLNAIGLGIGLSCLAISHYGLGQIWPALQTPLADNISGQLVGTAVGTLFRFWSYRRFVFRDTTPPDQVTTGPRSKGHATNVASPAPVRDSA